MDFLEVFLFEYDLVGDRLSLLIEIVYLFFVNGHVLHLVSQKSTLAFHSSLLLNLRPVFQLILLGCSGTIYRLLDSLHEVHDLVVDEVLVDLHLFLEVAHLALINQL